MKELGAAICCPERLKKVINFFVVGLTYGCRKSWILMRFTPAFSAPLVISWCRKLFVR